MLIEYAWAIYSQNPDEREKAVLDRAYQLIRKLIEERDGPDSVSADSELLFPGEVGDSFAESLVIFRFPASSQSATDYDKTLGETAKKAAVDFLKNDGEKARGVTIIPEYYADNDYDSSGALIVCRTHPKRDPDEVSRKVVRMFKEGKAPTIDGKEFDVKATTVCVHSDTPNVVDIARALKEAMKPWA